MASDSIDTIAYPTQAEGCCDAPHPRIPERHAESRMSRQRRLRKAETPSWRVLLPTRVGRNIHACMTS